MLMAGASITMLVSGLLRQGIKQIWEIERGMRQWMSQLMAAMLANPHIYPNISDDGVQGQRKKSLMVLAIEMAQSWIEKAGSRSD